MEGPPHNVVREDGPKAGREFYYRCVNCEACFYDRAAKEPIPAFPQVEAKPVGTDLYERGLCLPSDLHMDDDDMKLIIETVRDCF